jgi:hypothetical protein
VFVDESVVKWTAITKITGGTLSVAYRLVFLYRLTT